MDKTIIACENCKIMLIIVLSNIFIEFTLADYFESDDG